MDEELDILKDYWLPSEQPLPKMFLVFFGIGCGIILYGIYLV